MHVAIIVSFSDNQKLSGCYHSGVGFLIWSSQRALQTLSENLNASKSARFTGVFTNKIQSNSNSLEEFRTGHEDHQNQIKPESSRWYNCRDLPFGSPPFLCVLEESKRDSVLMLSFNLCFNKTCMSARLAYLFVFQIAAVKLSIVFFCFHRDIW